MKHTLTICRIFNYLNSKTGKSYDYTKYIDNQDLLMHLNEGYVFQDFKKIIDNKCQQWIGSTFEQYLRPETLFGKKFKLYLNERNSQTKLEKLVKSVEKAKSANWRLG